MKVLILGASGFFGGILYGKIKEETDFWALGTYHESKKNDDFIKLDVTNFIEVEVFLQHFNADVIIWCLMSKTNEKVLINQGLPNVLTNMNPTCKFIFIESNSEIDDEKLVRKLENYIVIRPGVIEDQYINELATGIIKLI